MLLLYWWGQSEGVRGVTKTYLISEISDAVPKCWMDRQVYLGCISWKQNKKLGAKQPAQQVVRKKITSLTLVWSFCYSPNGAGLLLRSYQYLSRLLNKESPPLELPFVPFWVQCHPDDKSAVLYIEEYHNWPAWGSSFAAVASHRLNGRRSFNTTVSFF